MFLSRNGTVSDGSCEFNCNIDQTLIEFRKIFQVTSDGEMFGPNCMSLIIISISHFLKELRFLIFIERLWKMKLFLLQ